jgi:hypothetical protein
MAEKPETKKAAPAKAKAPDLFSQLPAPALARVAALPDRRSCVVRAGDDAIAVRRIGDKLRALRGKAEADFLLLRALLGKKKPKGAADVDVSAVRSLLN